MEQKAIRPDKGEYFTLALPKKKTLNEMVLISDSYLDMCYHTTLPSPKRNGVKVYE